MEFALGFDYGLTRIGVATGQTLTQTASPLTTIRAHNGVPDWMAIQKLLDDWAPHIVIVGLPLHADGTKSEMAQRAEKFGRRISGRFGIKVDYVNEFETTRQARDCLNYGMRACDQDGMLDATSACFILERWLGGKDD